MRKELIFISGVQLPLDKVKKLAEALNLTIPSIADIRDLLPGMVNEKLIKSKETGYLGIWVSDTPPVNTSRKDPNVIGTYAYVYNTHDDTTTLRNSNLHRGVMFMKVYK